MTQKKPFPEKIEKRLRLTTLRSDLEPLARELMELASAGSRELWGELTLDRLKEDVRFRRRFHELAHEGMFKAQEKMEARISSGTALDVSEEILFRGIADAIAWGMIGGQLCYARRMYRSHEQPNFSQSNFDSVLRVCKELRAHDPGCMPLIADLTSFVQVGDIINVSAERRISIIEVKEGEHNKYVVELARFYDASGCERFREILEQTESPKTVKQFGRVVRQKARMSHVRDVMASGSAKDPDTGEVVHIPEPFFEIETWEKPLGELIKKAQAENWAYDVKGAIFMGAYAGQTASRGHALFLMALGLHADVEKDYYIVRLADCMQMPLAPPLFSRSLDADVIMDLLFGRMNVCIAICMPALIHAAEMSGMDVRYATRKELGRAKAQGMDPVVYCEKGLMFSLNGKEMILLGGILHRAMFHNQQPVSILRHYLENSDFEAV